MVRNLKPQEVFAQRLKELREENQLTQEQLADQISTSKQVISRYEKNQREPGINIVAKIADFFQVSIDYLAGKINHK
ncbi:DNA-binding XRE family transcriptional regulator [Hydrogenispora ethanolica]|jgi:transcriptional regulator with XRE-family HTH domain|uniref:DNA-binding XRE family transcriptional regulator n=1 Tax=Hydrogenispora ethanolica TaxID=1082276 RepID=A0A4R1R8F3_HYDET|nr:helix-turn-helix transcriptional regulator [Hydrogenispora ethanolica]TCL61933.1 DNA-binding XRE family transcriptional regulator [Hydrogenispora ethanolica]